MSSLPDNRLHINSRQRQESQIWTFCGVVLTEGETLQHYLDFVLDVHRSGKLWTFSLQSLCESSFSLFYDSLFIPSHTDLLPDHLDLVLVICFLPSISSKNVKD